LNDAERFRDKTQQFLKAQENDLVIHKLRWNEPLSKADLDALEKPSKSSLGSLTVQTHLLVRL
jgi:type I site-specific restriction endonuclease